jgi:ABC-type branched-subunit amino acid transport system substrate-binding protein
MRQHVKVAAVATVAALALAACGSHSSSTASSTPSAASTSSSPAAAPSTTPSAAASSPTAATSSTAASSPAAASSAAASGPGTFGTLGQVCGPGTATGATDVGITNTAIEAGTIADVGWSVEPGLLQPIFDAADAFVGWCNAAGGINGRKITLDKRDSAFSNYLPQVKASCPTDVALVGSMGILDDTGAAAWEACGMPNFTAATVGAVAANAKLMYPMTPIPADQQTIGGFHLLFDQNPAWKSAVGSLYSNGAAGDREQHTYNEAITSLGAKVVYTAEYTPTTTNWAPYIQAMKSAGVKFLFLNDTDTTSAAIEQAMATAGWYPEIQISPSQLYTQNMLTLAGKIAQNYYTYIPITPFEAASSVPAIQTYLTLLNQYAPKATKTFFGVTAFSAWLLFAEAVKSCGSNVTRTCIESYVTGQTAWTGGGLQGPINPAANVASQCFILMKVDGTQWTQAYPSTLGQYDCSPLNAPKVAP